jgi:hypothetical protein
VEFGEEFGHEGRVLGWEGEDPEPPKSFWDTNILPSDFALAAMTGFFPGPEESTSPLVDGLNDTCREEARAHGMREHRREDRVDQDQPPANRKTPALPPRETHVAFGHDGGEVSQTQLVGGKRKAKIGLREGGDLAAKSSCHGGGNSAINFDGDKCTFVEVYG